jgi:hypothetical protein
MGDQPQRNRTKAELSLMKRVLLCIYGEHKECWVCGVPKDAFDSAYPRAQLTKVGGDYYCSESIPQGSVGELLWNIQ